MKKLLTVLATLAAATSAASAATLCVPGTLATYVALGSTGCNIGVDTLSGFSTIAGITGAVAINPTAVTIIPSGGTTNPTLTYGVNATTTGILEAIFTYRLSGASFTGSTIILSGTSSTGGGVATHIQNICGGGTFGPDGVSNCSGSTQGPLAAISNGSDQVTFAGVPFLTITDDFTLDGGLGGSSSGGTFADSFTATAPVSPVPEPGTILITSLGGALLLGLKSRIARKRETHLIKESL